MKEAPIPPDEENRLALLRARKIMYTPAEEAFDDVARLAAVEQIVFKCLRKNRDERFQSMRDLAESLRAVALGA